MALVSGYRPPAGSYDEMLAADGSVRAHYRPLIGALSGWTGDERRARFRSAAQYLSEAGVFYRVYEAGNEARSWPLSHPPLILAQAEWETLEAGLKQRALYLERLMADLYGNRDLVREGLLPGLLLGRNPEFLRPVADQARAGAPLIRFIAVDLGRRPDGQWVVLGDRTQAPSGAGFALENRVAGTRAFPELAASLSVRRLAGFFDRFRRTLEALNENRSSKLGLLTPGPSNETYFEHAYLARYLGLQLLEGGDLTAADGRVAVRTVEGPAPISVLWRRLDADFADPLELFSGSAIGMPGLAGAVRAGSVQLVNALGSGILETRAFLAFKAALAERLLGERLTLPSIPTRWCGTAEEHEYIETGLTIAEAFPGAYDDPRACDARLAEDPASLVAQESLRLSTMPAFVGDAPKPHVVTLRVFLARGEDGWEAMPGGFARLSREAGASSLSMQAGGRSADVWVISDRSEPPITLLSSGGSFRRRLPGALPARAADNLYWLGRMAERTEAATRLARIVAARRVGTQISTPLDRRLAEHLGGILGDAPDHRSGLASLAQGALDIAARIRDRFSPDGWRALAEVVALLRTPSTDEDELYSRTLTQLAGFTGLVRENMYQFTGWRFLEIGRQIERASQTARLGSLLLDPASGEEGVCEALLEFADSRMTYRRRFSVDLDRSAVVDLCILDPLNPRSLAFQAKGVAEVYARLPGAASDGGLGGGGRRLARLCVRLRTASAEEVDAAFLTRVAGDLADISDLLSARWLASGAAATSSPRGGSE